MRNGKFWLVWKEHGSAPTFKHESLYSARSEAERLARQMPGAAFHVLEVVGTVNRIDVQWTDYPTVEEGDTPDPPF